MPIYAYKCESCGHSKDVLQKISDAPLSVCPACGADSFRKQLTAAGFQLKGSGWYVTDFRGGASGAPSTGTATATDSAETKASTPTEAKPAVTPAAKSEASPTASGGCGGGCACH